MADLICAAVWLVTSSIAPEPAPLPVWQLPQLLVNSALPSSPPPELLVVDELEELLELDELEVGQLPVGAAFESNLTLT